MRPRPAQRTPWTPLLALALTGGVVSGVGAQTVDQGVFRLSVHGEPIGQEEFVIQRTGSGAAQNTLARGTQTLDGGGSITTHLQVTGPALTVFRYSVKVTGEDERAVNVARTGNRLQARTVAAWGEELREYRATPATLLLERGVAHHYFLLAPLLDAPPRSSHAVSPLSESEETLSGLRVSSATRDVAGETLQVRVMSFTVASSTREAWFDSSGHLVRVSDSSTGLVAERLPES